MDATKPRYSRDGGSRKFGVGISAWRMQRNENYEQQGTWNKVDIMAVDDDLLFAVNAHVVMRLEDCKIVLQSHGQRLSEGRIQIQSEAADVMYHPIRIRSLAKLPAGDVLDLQN